MRQLKRAKEDPAQLVCFFVFTLRVSGPCLNMLAEFSTMVYLSISEELENIQRRALRIIFAVLGYQEALKECNIATLYQRRQLLTERLFNEIREAAAATNYMAFCRHVIVVP